MFRALVPSVPGLFYVSRGVRINYARRTYQLHTPYVSTTHAVRNNYARRT